MQGAAVSWNETAFSRGSDVTDRFSWLGLLGGEGVNSIYCGVPMHSTHLDKGDDEMEVSRSTGWNVLTGTR